jgi:hypothetical protein
MSWVLLIFYPEQVLFLGPCNSCHITRSNKWKKVESIWAVTMWVWQGSMKDEKLYTQFWVSRSDFLVTLIFDFLALGGSLARTRCAISLKYVPKIQKFNNLSKTGSFVEIFQRELKKFCLVTPKNVKKWHFLAIFFN